MKCSTLEPWLIDLARGVAVDRDRATQVEQHVRECGRCQARLDTERAISAALRRLAQSTGAPALRPSSEAAVLAAFDAAQTPYARTHGRVIYAAAAAALFAVAMTVAWTHERHVVRVATTGPSPSRTAPQPPIAAAPSEAATAIPPRHLAPRRRPPAARAATGFVRWPGAADLPAFESGHLMRVDLSAALAMSLGLAPPAQTAVVQADVLVGQDGFARAVRLAP